jgi:cytochrome c biogenesis protein CcmG/thiol:disulfide interchange protein DsbE
MNPIKKWLIISSAFAVFVGMCYFAGRADQTGPSLQTIASDPKNKAPDFVLPLVGAKTSVRLSEEVKKHPVVIAFWASFCVPCRSELPQIDKLAAKYAGRAAFIGINGSDAPSDVAEYARQYHLTFPMLWDKDQHTTLQYHVQSIPYLYVIDTHGIVRAISDSASPHIDQELTPVLDTIIQEAATGSPAASPAKG